MRGRGTEGQDEEPRVGSGFGMTHSAPRSRGEAGKLWYTIKNSNGLLVSLKSNQFAFRLS